jgi:hypothetical protein
VTASWSTIDCDVHVNVPNMQALLPYLDEFWRDSVLDRGMNSLESISYPPRPDPIGAAREASRPTPSMH